MKDEALKLALEALKRMKGYGDTFGYASSETNPYEQVCEAITAIKEALAQPAQEPWRESASDYERGVIDGRQKQAQSSVDKAVNRMAQRPWVGLTDAEKDGKRLLENGLLFNAAEVQAWELGVEYAEAKLKEKNNG